MMRLAFVALLVASPLRAVQATPVLQPHLDDTKRYFESWAFMAMLADGTYVQGLLVVSNIGLGQGYGACRLLLAVPGRPPQNLSKSVDDHWDYNSTPEPSLRMGSCRAVASADRTRLDITLEGTLVSLQYTAAMHPVIPPGLPVRVGDAVYETDIAIPFAEVEAVVRAPGLSPEKRRGYGYVDHARSTTVPRQMGRGSMRFRGFAPGCHTVFYVRFSRPDVPPPGFAWRAGEARPQSISGWQVALPSQDAGVDATVITLKDPADPNAIGWTVRARQRLFRQAPLEDFGLLGRLVGAWMGSVVNETFTAVFDDGANCRAVPGILEIDHNN